MIRFILSPLAVVFALAGCAALGDQFRLQQSADEESTATATTVLPQLRSIFESAASVSFVNAFDGFFYCLDSECKDRVAPTQKTPARGEAVVSAAAVVTIVATKSTAAARGGEEQIAAGIVKNESNAAPLLAAAVVVESPTPAVTVTTTVVVANTIFLETVAIATIFFDSGSSAPLTAYFSPRPVTDADAAGIFLIEAFTDETGTPAGNRRLALQRALAVAKETQSLLVEAAEIQIAPRPNCCFRKSRTESRRAVLHQVFSSTPIQFNKGE